MSEPRRPDPERELSSAELWDEAGDEEAGRRVWRELFRQRDTPLQPRVDGRPAGGALARSRRRGQRLLVSKGEREEAELERLLGQTPVVSRPNLAAIVSPRGGVGKTTSTLMIGGLLADRLRLRVVAVDADPDFGTLAALVPDRLRCQRSLADLLADIDRIETATQLRSYVSVLPTGLHLLGGPTDAALMATLGPDAYGELVTLLATFYDLVLLDLATGVAGRLPQFAIHRADQVVLVTTPETSADPVAQEHLDHERTTVACNKFYARHARDLRELERILREHQGLQRPIAIPHDDQLAAMLDSGTYQLDALERLSRMAIKRLALAVADQLVRCAPCANTPGWSPPSSASPSPR